MTKASTRLTNIDMLRGIVMILMCIDHARDYTLFHPTDPMTLSDTPFSVWLLRILAHFCAPTFIFLAGISAWISGRKKRQRRIIFLSVHKRSHIMSARSHLGKLGMEF